MRILLYAFFILLVSTSLQAQGKAKTFNLKKGETFDLIFFSYNDSIATARKRYFKEAIPLAMADGYQPRPGFQITGPALRGNDRPEVLVTGVWPGEDSRAATLTKLESNIPDFHEQRRTIWSQFDVTYYILDRDISFVTDPTKFYVVTLVWAAARKPFHRYLAGWEDDRKAAGGKSLLSLTNGKSPFGYHHQPDYFTLTEWADEAAYRKFRAAERPVDQAAVRQLNELHVR